MGFDKQFWDAHWHEGREGGTGSMASNPPSPYLARELAALAPGSALDAGCGAGAEAIELASWGWQVTGVDVSSEALAAAAAKADDSGAGAGVRWVEADLGSWEPGCMFDLVMTHYAHASIPQLELYRRLASWVAPGGTLLVVGHLPGGAPHDGHAPDHDDHHGDHHSDPHGPPAEATASAAAVAGLLDPAAWQVLTSSEEERRLPGPEGRESILRDVVVRAVKTG